jgi:hypothetical protein
MLGRPHPLARAAPARGRSTATEPPASSEGRARRAPRPALRGASRHHEVMGTWVSRGQRAWVAELRLEVGCGGRRPPRPGHPHLHPRADTHGGRPRRPGSLKPHNHCSYSAARVAWCRRRGLRLHPRAGTGPLRRGSQASALHPLGGYVDRCRAPARRHGPPPPRAADAASVGVTRPRRSESLPPSCSASSSAGGPAASRRLPARPREGRGGVRQSAGRVTWGAKT